MRVCCYCGSARTGSLIIGIIEIIIFSGAVVTAGFKYGEVLQALVIHGTNSTAFDQEIKEAEVNSTDPDRNDTKAEQVLFEEEIEREFVAACFMFSIYSIISLFLGVVLIVSVFKASADMLKFYLSLKIIVMTVGLVFTFLSLIRSFPNWDSISSIVLNLFGLYFMLVVYTHYKELKTVNVYPITRSSYSS